MKKYLILLAAAAVVSMASGCAAQMTSEEKAAVAARVRQQIADRSFVIDVRTVYPMGWRAIDLSPGFTLRIQGDSIHSYLPFFGRVYQMPIRFSDGLRFDVVAEEFHVSTRKKNETTITFMARTFEDRFIYTVTIFPNGSANIHVRSDYRSSINYSGVIRPPGWVW